MPLDQPSPVAINNVDSQGFDPCHSATGGTNGVSTRHAVSPDLANIVAQLRDVRERWRHAQKRPRDIGGRELPSREALSAIALALRGALFPMRLGPPDLRQESEDYYVGHTLDAVLGALLTQVRLELRYHA